MNHRAVRATAAVAMAGIAGVYLVETIVRHRASLAAVRWFDHPWLIAASIVVNGASLSAGCWLWWLVLARSVDAGHRPAFGALWRVWAMSNPARYLPGRVWHVATLGWLGASAGIPWTVIVTSLLVHMWFVLLGNLVLALSALPFIAITPWAAWSIASGVVLAATIGIHPRILNAALAVAGRLSRKTVVRWRPGVPFGATLLMLDAANVIVAGVGACLLARATVGLGVTEFPAMIAAQALAFIVGYVSLVPAGLGVREAALTLALTPIMPVERSAGLALILRLWNGAAEALLLGAAMAMPRPAALASADAHFASTDTQ